MAFVGLGGGVNLGAATGYLFIDGTGMRRGLNTAGGALDEFAAKSEARSRQAAQSAFRSAKAFSDSQQAIAAAQAASAQKVTDAMATRLKNITKIAESEAKKIQAIQDKAVAASQRAQTTGALVDPTTQKRVVDLANEVAAANTSAAQVITRGYRDREAALKALSGTTASETAKQVAAQAALNAAIEKQAALQKRLAEVNKALAKDSLLATDKRSLTSQKGGLTAQLNRATAEVQRLRAEADAAESSTRAARARSIEEAKKVALAAQAAEQAAINETRKALNAQNKEYQKLATIAGPSAQKLANEVNKAGREVVLATQQFAKLNGEIAKQQRTIAGAKDQNAIIAAEAKAADLVAQRAKAYDRLLAAQQAYTQKSKEFGAELEKVHSADLANEARATAALTAARIDGAQKVTAVTVAEDEKLTKLRAAENAKVVALEKQESDKIVAIKQQEAQKVAAAIKDEQAAQANISRQSFSSVLQGATFATVALGAAVGVATSQFGGFEEQLHNIASISNDVDFVFGEMQEAIKDLAVERGQSPEALATALYDIVSSGFQAQEALTILDASSKAAVAGLTDVGSAGKSLTAVINAYKTATGDAVLTTADIGHVADVAFAAVREGVFTFKELTQQQGDNLSIAAELGVTYEELASAYVVLTRRGNSLAESTTQINGIMRTFLKPNEKLAEVIEAYGEQVLNVDGLTGAALITQYGFGQALQFVNDVTRDSADALGQLFPNVRALRGQVGLTGDDLAEFNHQLAIMEASSLGVGAAQRAFEQQAQAFNFQLNQAKETARVAAIEFGSTLAPGVLFAAQAAAAAASAYSALPGPVKEVIGAVTGFSLTTAVAIVVVGNMTRAVIAGVVGFRALKVAIAASTRAMTVFQLVASPLGIALAGLALIAIKMRQRQQEEKQSVESLADAYQRLRDAVEGVSQRSDLTANQQAGLQNIISDVNTAIRTVEEFKDIVQTDLDEATSGDWTGNMTVGFDNLGHAIEETNVEAGEMFDRLNELEDFDAEKVAADLEVILSTPDLDVDFVQKEIRKLLSDLRSGDITATEFANAIASMASNTDSLTRAARAADQAIAEEGSQLRSLGDFFGEAGEKADEFRKGLQGLAKQALVAAGAADDFSSPLAFIQNQIGGMGETAAQTLLRLQKLGKVSFGDTQQAAIQAVATLDKFDQKIQEVNDSISESQQRSSEWAQIQSLVSETVGTEADNFATLNDLAQRFGLTQKEVNDIREAAIFLNQRAVLGIEEERLAVAQSLPDLAAFVHQHDLAQSEYDSLDPAARGFAQALQDANVQAAIMTVTMLKLASALDPDNFPPEFVTEFIVDISKANPAVAAVLDELGFIPEEVRTEIFVGNEHAIRSLEAVQIERSQVEDEIGRLTSLGRELTAEELAQLALLERRLNQLKLESVGFQVDRVVGEDELPNLTDQVQGLDAEISELQQNWIDAFTKMENATDSMSESVLGVLPGLFDTAAGIEDFSDPLAFLQKHLSLIGPSFAQALLQGEQFGHLQFTDLERGALRVQANIDALDEMIRQLDQSIADNETEMQQWQSRMDLVDRTIGTAENGYAELNQLLQTGKITQQEYNDILAAGVFIRQRSVDGVLDERAEVAKSLPDLANYIAKHDNLATSYSDLSGEQRGFLAALKDEGVQTALNTFLMLKFLEAMNGVPQGTADRFLQAVSAQNEAVEALLIDLGLMPAQVETDVVVNTPEPGSVEQEVDSAVPDETTVELGFTTGTTPGGGIADIPDQEFTVTANTTQAQSAVASLLANLRQAIVQANSSGQQIGYFFDVGVTTAIIDNMGDVFATNTLFYENWNQIALAARNIFGPNVGRSFDYGVAAGVYNSAGAVQSAGTYIGRLLFASAMIAILSRSPSRKGAEVGSSFVQGITQGVYDEQAAAVAAVQSTASAMVDAFHGEINAGRAFSTDIAAGQANALAAKAAVPNPGGRGGTGANSLMFVLNGLNVTVPGAGDPAAVARAVGSDSASVMWDEFVNAIARLESQVVT